MSVGLKARLAHAEAVVLDALQHPACILKFVEAEQLAFIDGALSPAGSPVPMMLVDEYYLAQAFLSGQEKRRNKYGFVLDGRWVYHHEVCKRCQKADYPIVKPHAVCGECFVEDVRKARHHEGGVDEAFLQVDLPPDLQLQSQGVEQALQDAAPSPLRALERRNQGAYPASRSARSAQAAPMRNALCTPPYTLRSSFLNGPARTSAYRSGGGINEKKAAIPDAEAATF